MEHGPTAEHRLSVRIPASLYSELVRLAEDQYEGKLSMLARKAFRLLVDDERDAQPAPVTKEAA